MKKLIFFFLIAPFYTIAQDKLQVEGTAPNLYVTHKVAAKENYYSIGRIYNISPKDIAPFNKLDIDKGLSLGQAIKVPLNSSNFFQSGTAADDETFVPVYYKIKDKEGLYRVAKNNNNLPLEMLKQWNGLTGDAVKNGMQLVVGYLKVKTALSALAKAGVGNSIGAAVIAATEEKKTTIPDVVATPAVKPAEKTKTKESAKQKTTKQTEIKTVTDTEKPVAKGETKSAAEETKKSTWDKNSPETNFKNLYELQVKTTQLVEANGNMGVFKSTSGWSDKKYYCLHNSAAQGAIIKITNPANGNIVFAKVLDGIPDIKKNDGLEVIISSAAADALGVTADGNASCTISYAK